MCPFKSDVYFVDVDCNFSHWTTFNSLRQLGPGLAKSPARRPGAGKIFVGQPKSPD